MMENVFGYLTYLSQAIVVLKQSGEIKFLNLKAKDLFDVNSHVDRIHLSQLLSNVHLSSYETMITDILNTITDEKKSQNLRVKREEIELTFHFFTNEEDIIIEVLSQTDDSIMRRGIFDFMVNNSSDLVFFKDGNLAYKMANEVYLNLLNIPKEQLLGVTDEVLMARGVISPILYYQCVEGDKEALEKGTYSSIEILSNESYYQVSKKLLYNGILCIARDITNEVNFNKQLEIDEMTGLYNRKVMTRMLKKIPKEKGYHAIGINLQNLGEIVKVEGIKNATKYVQQIATLLKQNQDALFFYVEGVGFIGLFDKVLSRPEKVLEQFKSELSSLNLSSHLQLDITIIMLDEKCTLFTLCD